MDRETRRQLESYRRHQAGPYENTLLDEFAAGEFDREQFLRRATVLGLSGGVIGAALAWLRDAPLASAATGAARAGGRLRVGIIPPPTGAIEPHMFADQGSLEVGSITGEFLTRATQSKTLLPELATSWKPNADATVWTFTLRPGVKFQTGQAMSADDVVTTWKRLASKGSQALSAIGSYLTPAGVQKVDDMTVAFHLESPVSNFAYLTSSDTYQAIILPANYQLGSFTKTPQTTGAFQISSYTPGVGASYDRFSGWWGGQAPLDGVDATFYSAAAAADAALLGSEIDLLGQIQLATDRALFSNSSVQIFTARGASHREVPMRVDLTNPLHDYRVRQAIALSLDRPAIVKTLFNDLADIGNDSPFAPIYGLARGVPQRTQDMAKAKQLMAAAGYEKGFALELTTEQVGEIPELAQIIQSSVKPLGITLGLKVLTSTAYYAGSQTGPPSGYGSTDWLNAPMDITDWGSRPVPNVFLVSALETKGVWNAAHYSNPAFDSGVRSFLAAASFADQNKYATTLQQILLHDTPVIFPYFYYYIAAGSKSVKGYKADALGVIYLSKTSLA